jgi:hydrogenase-4 component F
MLPALIAIPLLAALATGLVRRPAWNRAFLVGAALVHAGLTVATWIEPAEPVLDGWLGLDALGRWFLTAVSVLNLATAFYSVGYLARRRRPRDVSAEPAFVALLLVFLSTMTLATAARHFELLWVAIEATTLASAPLIYFHPSRHSLEATWKYLIVCSVGIGLALLGTVFLGVASALGGTGSLGLDALVGGAARLDGTWVRLAFVFLVVGYGTKAGLAPLHAWLPDAHSEAPSPVSALLSGASLNCALLGVLRGLAVAQAAGVGDFARGVLVALGLVSLAFAAVFVVGQKDFKRLLAYSSVEHMGIVALGVGIGGAATTGALLHAFGHALTKGMLFLVAGNLLSGWHSKRVDEVRGALRRAPATGALWLVGLFLITGAPPSPLFVSELAVLKGALDAGRIAIAVAYLAGLTVVFVGMAAAFLPMALGRPEDVPTRPGDDGRDRRDTAWLIAPPALLALGIVALGLAVPGPLADCLVQAAGLVTGGAR